MIYEEEERPGQAVDEMVARWEEQDRKRNARDADPRADVPSAESPDDFESGGADMGGCATLTIKSSKQFVAEFVSPDYTVDGLLQEGIPLLIDRCNGRRQNSDHSTSCGLRSPGRFICRPRN